MAVDGSESTPSLAVGRNGQPPWWEVDLGAVQPLDGLEIGFHTGCCADGGRSAYVFLSERPFENDDPILAAATPGVLAFAVDTPTAVQTLRLTGRSARYVRIQSSRPGWLRLGSVHVWQAAPETITPEAGQSPTGVAAERQKPADRPNLALGKRTRQSSTVAPNTANYAVDGRTDGDIAQGSLALTQPEPHAWWEVDLADSYKIGDILIWNRTDCCQSWLQGYYVLVSDEPIVSPRLPQAAGQPGVASYYVPGGGASPTTIGIHRQGRYVRIQLTRADPLALAEVQVFAP